MRYLAVATDYDGTLAHDGRVDERTVETLRRVRDSGRYLILVTGRHLEDLQAVFPQLELFHVVVAENGALLYWPESRREKALAPGPPEALVRLLRDRGVSPLGVGRVMINTVVPHDETVLHAIRRLGLEHQVIFNKGAVMVLPPGINKASGLEAVLKDLGVPPQSVVAFGDAENDHAFLRLSGFSVAVANALQALKDEADYVAHGERGAGVSEVLERLLENDLAGFGNDKTKRTRAV